MKNQFPRLDNLLVFCLRQGTNDVRTIFSKLMKYPVVPGSRVPAANRRLKYGSRRIESVKEPIRLRYWGAKVEVVGAEYHGKGMDQVLSALADTVETEITTRS